MGVDFSVLSLAWVVIFTVLIFRIKLIDNIISRRFKKYTEALTKSETIHSLEALKKIVDADEGFSVSRLLDLTKWFYCDFYDDSDLENLK